MTNVMFLPPGGLVVEMVGEFKDVNMPLGDVGLYRMEPAVAASEARRFYDHLRNQTNLKT
eukprot:gene39862-53898_t